MKALTGEAAPAGSVLEVPSWRGAVAAARAVEARAVAERGRRRRSVKWRRAPVLLLLLLVVAMMLLPYERPKPSFVMPAQSTPWIDASSSCAFPAVNVANSREAETASANALTCWFPGAVARAPKL